QNQADFTFTSAEPAGNPSGFIVNDNPNTPFTGADGGGCVYMYAGFGPVIESCDFAVNKGICLYTGMTFNLEVRNCTFSGTYGGGVDPYSHSYGVFASSGLIYHGGRTNILGVNICVGGSPAASGLEVSNVNCEVSGVGISAGQNPVSFWWNDR